MLALVCNECPAFKNKTIKKRTSSNSLLHSAIIQSLGRKRGNLYFFGPTD